MRPVAKWFNRSAGTRRSLTPDWAIVTSTSYHRKSKLSPEDRIKDPAIITSPNFPQTGASYHHKSKLSPESGHERSPPPDGAIIPSPIINKW